VCSSLRTGRPYGLYGGAFAAASEAAIRNASVVLKPPTISNILALEAPPGGRGAYRYGTLVSIKTCVRGSVLTLQLAATDEIQFILRTAFSGYRAAVVESSRAAKEKGFESAPPFVIIHTGNWGTGSRHSPVSPPWSMVSTLTPLPCRCLRRE
jgi:hypothetical protein